MRASGLGLLLGLGLVVATAAGCGRSAGWRARAGAARADIPASAAAQAPARAQDLLRAQLIRRMDGYFDRPNAAATWRALSGRGDPRIAGEEVWSRAGRAAVDASIAARLRPAGMSGPIYDGPGGFGGCRTDYAAAVAQRRIAGLGAASPYVAQWFAVQRAVFSACADPYQPRAAAAALPPPLEGLPRAAARLQAQDRAYQQASLDFYRGERAAALQAFAQIGASASEHRAFARYMVVAIRAGSGPENAGRTAAPTATPARSVAEIDAILADPGLADAHEITRSLLGWVSYTSEALPARRAHVRAALQALRLPSSRLKADADARADYARAITDVDFMMAPIERPDWWLHGDVSPRLTANRALSEAARRDSLAAWLAIPTSHFHAAPWSLAEVSYPADPAEARWRAVEEDVRRRVGTDGEAWRVLEMTLSPYYGASDWDRVDAETAAVASGRGDDRAVAALPIDFYHQVRLALMARADSDAFPAALARLQAYPFKDSRHYRQAVADSLRYLMTTGRISEARRLRDAVGADRLPPLEGAWEPEGGLHALLLLLAEDDAHLARALRRPLYADQAVLLNQLSIGALQRLAARTDVDPGLRALFARTAWTRTYALGRAVDRDLDRLMRQLNPALVRQWRSRPGDVRPGDHNALLDVLASPALNILITDHSRGADLDGDRPAAEAAAALVGIDTYQHSDNNWWCAWQPDRHAAAFETGLGQDFITDSRPADGRAGAVLVALRGQLASMLRQSRAVNAQSAAELDALSRIACAPKSLSLAAVDWARRPSPFRPHRDPAEALALSIRATRYGCQRQGGHGVYSREAFRLLHRLYGDTAAARRTPAWFDCSHFSGGCPARPGAA